MEKRLDLADDRAGAELGLAGFENPDGGRDNRGREGMRALREGVAMRDRLANRGADVEQISGVKKTGGPLVGLADVLR